MLHYYHIPLGQLAEKIGEAKGLITDIFSEPKINLQNLFSQTSLEALALIRKYDPESWFRLRHVLKERAVLCDLEPILNELNAD